MMFFSLFCFQLYGCGGKTNDSSINSDTGSTQDSGASNDTQETGGTSDTQDSGDTNDTGDTNEQNDTGDTTDTAPDDTGEVGVNTSETPPTGSCTENTVKVQVGDLTYNLKGFYWDMAEDETGTTVLLNGYNSASVDVCSTQDFLNYSQASIVLKVNLSEMPQTLALGVVGYSQNSSGTLTFIEDPTDTSTTFYYSLEGETLVNSFIAGSNSGVSQLNIGQMGYDTSGGNFSSFETIDIQFSGGTDIVGCYCEGMMELYNNLSD